MQSAVAPQSMRTNPPFWVGTTGHMAARRMPQMRLTIRVAADRSAPVEPAETKASASPSLSFCRPTVMEESFFSLKARAGLSSMVMTWEAGRISMPLGTSLWPSFSRQAMISWGLPERITSTPRVSAALTAPSTGASGALSPPMASRIILISFPFSNLKRYRLFYI